MRWLPMFPLALLLACNSAQLKPVDNVPIDWKACPAALEIPPPPGGWKNETWIWKDDAQTVIGNNHICIDQVAKNSEENQRRVKYNAEAYAQKRAPIGERVTYWMEGAGLAGLIAVVLFVLL